MIQRELNLHLRGALELCHPWFKRFRVEHVLAAKKRKRGQKGNRSRLSGEEDLQGDNMHQRSCPSLSSPTPGVLKPH